MFLYCDNPDDDEPIFRLFNQIGADENKPEKPYVDGNQFARELLFMDGLGKKRIQIWLNCEGGNIKDGFSIIAAILKTKTKVDTLNVGIAYSMAGVIGLMGRKNEALDYSSYMYHMGYNPDGTQDEGLNVLNQSLITAISNRSGKTEDEVRAILKATTYYSAQEARTAGLIDEVVPCNELNKPRAVALENYNELYTFGVNYVNKLFAQNKKMNKKEICAILGLDENVSDQVAMEKFKSYVAKAQAKADDDDGDDKKAQAKKMKKMEDDLAEAKASAAKAEDDLAKFKKEEESKASAKAEEDQKAKAKTEIEAKAKERKLELSADQLANYTALAGTSAENLAAVIKTIEAIPVTIKSAKMKTESINSKAAGSLAIKEITTAGTALGTIGHKEVEMPAVASQKDAAEAINSINSFDYNRDWKNRQR